VIDPGQQETRCHQRVSCTAVSTRRAPEGIRTPNLLIRSRARVVLRRPFKTLLLVSVR
jgi:hypothetical protein